MPPPLAPPRGRGWIALFVALMVLTCLVASIATVLYLNGSYLAPGATGGLTP